MNITMDDSRITTVAELRSLLNSAHKIAFSLTDASIEEKYAFIRKTIKTFSYRTLPKKEKRIVYLYLRKITGYKKAQLYRLLSKAETGTLEPIPYHRVRPHTIYTAHDIKRLEETDELHLRLSEDAIAGNHDDRSCRGQESSPTVRSCTVLSPQSPHTDGRARLSVWTGPGRAYLSGSLPGEYRETS